jgi:CRISPR/Cas system-associated exonuclease Cas4 (RecB family)
MFKDIYYNYLIDNNKQQGLKRLKTKQKGWLSISSAGSCNKKQYYSTIREQETNPPTEDSLAKMQLGTILHSDFEKAMKHQSDMNNSNDKQYYYEYPVKIEELRLEGTLDMAIYDRVLNELYVADLKSIGSYPYKLRFGRDKAKNKNKVSNNYEMQVATYAIALSNKLEEPNVFPQLIFYNKDTSKIKSTNVPLYVLDDAMAYWEDLVDLIDELGDDFKDVSPDSMIGVPYSSWECNYCQYKDKCHNLS